MRDLCAGVNVDPGTAAAFRAQWESEVGAICTGANDADGIYRAVAPKPLLLKTDHMPGDDVVMTAAIYSLHRAHPGRYQVVVQSKYPEIFFNSPDVLRDVAGPPTVVQMHYPAIHQSNERGIHFMQAWCEHLGAALGVSVPLATNRPRLYFDAPAPPVEDFWVVCSGGKRDFTNKLWGHANYQEVVRALLGKVRFVQVGLATDDHRVLDRAHRDLVGQTTMRGLFDVVRRARGVLCGVSMLMHVAAALEKPAVVVAGGREPTTWNAYPKQQYLHTVGALPCRSTQGTVGGACWRSRVVPLGDATALDRDTCERPVDGVPECMGMVKPAEVAELILRYDRQY